MGEGIESLYKAMQSLYGLRIKTNVLMQINNRLIIGKVEFRAVLHFVFFEIKEIKTQIKDI